MGTGNGYLTFELVKAVSADGRVITYDYQKSNIDFVRNTNQGRFPIEARYQGLEYGLDVPDGSVDKVSTIATLHHYDDKYRRSLKLLKLIGFKTKASSSRRHLPLL